MDRERFQFFLYHAGWSNPPGRAVYAMALARAEETVPDAVRFRWEPDHMLWDADGPVPDEVLGCVMERRCEHCGEWTTVDSIWGIGDPDEAFRRLIEAELTLANT